MHRRQVLHGIGAIPLLGFAGHSAAQNSPDTRVWRDQVMRLWRARIDRFLAAGIVPIIDPESTWWHTIDLEYIVKTMDEKGVAQVCFAPNFQLGSETSLKLHERYPEHFIPTSADASSFHWDRTPRQFLDRIIADHAGGRYFLMGEYELRHYPSNQQWLAGNLGRDITLPWDHEAVLALFNYSQEHRVAFTIHLEIEDEAMDGLEKLLERYPGALVIWAHLGQRAFPERSKLYGVEYIRGLIQRFPNLHFDLGAVAFPAFQHPANKASGHYTHTLYAYTSERYDGHLLREWRDLMNAHPERFLIAFDMDSTRWRNFLPNVIDRFRYLILRELDERAQHLLAYRNAWRLITGEPWK